MVTEFLVCFSDREHTKSFVRQFSVVSAPFLMTYFDPMACVWWYVQQKWLTSCLQTRGTWHVACVLDPKLYTCMLHRQCAFWQHIYSQTVRIRREHLKRKLSSVLFHVCGYFCLWLYQTLPRWFVVVAPWFQCEILACGSDALWDTKFTSFLLPPRIHEPCGKSSRSVVVIPSSWVCEGQGKWSWSHTHSELTCGQNDPD